MSFPVAPANGAVATVNGIRYYYNSDYSAWIRLPNAKFTASATGPTNPATGDHWYDTNDDVLYEWTFDGTNYYWVDTSTAVVSGVTAPLTPFHPFLLAGM